MIVALFFVLQASADGREVVMRIGGREVSVAEFSYYYSVAARHHKESPSRYLQRFLLYKLKVADARSHGWDTLPDYRLQRMVLRGEALKKWGEASPAYNGLLRRRFADEESRLQDKSRVKFEHITLLLSQHASAAEERKARVRMDSVFRALQAGASFEALAARYALPAGQGGMLPSGRWLPEAFLIGEIADRLNSLQPGGWSAPFESPFGLHIVKLLERKPGVTFEEALPQLREDVADDVGFLMQLPDSLRHMHRVDSLSQMSLQLKQLDEALLAARWDKVHAAENERPVTENELSAYFEGHREDYDWTLPHFRGGVFYCRNKKAASALKKCIKKLPREEWAAAIHRLAATDSTLQCRMVEGVYAIGENPAVDKAVFKCGEAVPPEGYPYVWVHGKKLKRPKYYTDVREAVERDLRLRREEQLMEGLKRQYTVEIHQDVIKTVNCSARD